MADTVRRTLLIRMFSHSKPHGCLIGVSSVTAPLCATHPVAAYAGDVGDLCLTHGGVLKSRAIHFFFAIKI